ncbi:MAG: sensor histidine kinase [Streptosporangiaceae bacterium]
MQATLLEAVAGIGGQIEPSAALRRIVQAAVDLTGARYGALGLLGEGGRLSGFIPVGMTPAEIARVAHWPEGKGVLGELIRHPAPLRLRDLTAHPSSAGFPPGHPPMRSFLGAPVRIRDECFGNLYLTDKQGGADFDEEDEALLAAVAGAAGLAVENARLRVEARRHEQWQLATAEVTQRLLAADEPQDVFELVVRHALAISGADSVTISQPDATGDHIVLTHSAGSGTEGLVGMVSRAVTSLTAQVMASGQRIYIDDASTDERLARLSRERVQLGPAVAVPLGIPGDVRGAMVVGRRPGGQQLSPSVVEVVTTFAAQAGIGLKLAEHRRDTQRVALLADRDRIARDLHDLVIQRLFATGMSLQGAIPLVAKEEVGDRIGHAVDDLDATIRDIRSTIYSLQSRDESEQPGVQHVILAVVQEMTAALGFTPWLRLDGRLEDRVPREMTPDIAAVIRECLSNVARHSGASHADIVVIADEDVSVVVQDNGTGIAPDQPWSGLANLTGRAAELGGGLLIGEAADGGTRLEWRVPLPGAASR